MLDSVIASGILVMVGRRHGGSSGGLFACACRPFGNSRGKFTFMQLDPPERYFVTG